jgi:RNA 2',3'-cyclic 3'-phosphodiesterase
MLRLFFALQPSPQQSAALTGAAAPLGLRLRAQPVVAENLHATLCFIGAVAEEKLDALKIATSGVHVHAVNLSFDQLDYWAKPRILCAVATESASSGAHVLSAQLAQAAVAAGFAPDVKPFRAHLTLARKVDAAIAAECEWPLLLTPPMKLRCDRYVLMRSDRGESGSLYSVVAEWPLDANGDR